MKKPSKGLKEINGIWHIDIRKEDGGRVRLSTKTDDLEQAEQRLIQLKAEIFERRYIPNAQKKAEMTLEEGFNKVMKLEWSQQKTPMTVLYNWRRLIGEGKGEIQHLDPKLRLSEVTRPMLVEAVASLRDEGYTNASINRSMSVVRRILIAARDDWEVLAKAPKVPKEDEGEGRQRWLQDGEEEVIVGWFRDRKDDDMADLIEVLLESGCRLSEILGLEPSDINLFKREFMLWNTKNGKSEPHPIEDRTLQILTRRIKLDGYPFKALTRHAAIHRFQVMKKHCGYENDEELCLHTMRHTTASRMVQEGIDLKRVQQYMRHTTISTTLRYAKLNTSEKKETGKALREARTKRVQNLTKTCPNGGQELVKQG